MPTIIDGCDRLDRSKARRTTPRAGNSFRQIAGNAGRTCPSPVARHAALALSLWLAACAAPGSVASSPYHAPNDVDIGHAGGGGAGGGGGAM